MHAGVTSQHLMALPLDLACITSQQLLKLSSFAKLLQSKSCSPYEYIAVPPSSVSQTGTARYMLFVL